MKKKKIYDEYWGLLKDLELIAPESKLTDLKNIKKIV